MLVEFVYSVAVAERSSEKKGKKSYKLFAPSRAKPPAVTKPPEGIARFGLLKNTLPRTCVYDQGYHTSEFPRTHPLFWPLCGRPGGFSKIGSLSGFWPNPQVGLHSNVANCKGIRRHETKKARQFSIQDVSNILSCRDFYTYLCSQPKLLKAIRSSDKYTWSQPLAQSSSNLTVPESQDEADSVLMCLQYCYVTTSNSVVNYQDIFSVKFCPQCEQAIQ